jgi:cytochrome P450
MRALTLTIVVDALFQEDIGPETERFAQAITTVGEILAQQFVQPWLVWLPESFPLPVLRRKRRAVAELNRIVYGLIAKRRADAAQRTDLLSLLLIAEDEATGERMSDVQLHDEVLTLFIAGHETTALALTWAFVLLSQTPEVEAKLQGELDSVLAGRAPMVADRPHLPYTEAVIKETLRLYPPAPGILREALTTINLGTLTLEKGNIIWLSPYFNQRDSRYFDEPERFWPERFAPDESGRPLERRIPRFAYYPFGGGPRICIGNGFAMLEARLLLVTLAQQYQFRLADGYQPKMKFGATLGPDGPVPVQLIKR